MEILVDGKLKELSYVDQEGEDIAIRFMESFRLEYGRSYMTGDEYGFVCRRLAVELENYELEEKLTLKEISELPYNECDVFSYNSALKQAIAAKHSKPGYEQGNSCGA